MEALVAAGIVIPARRRIRQGFGFWRRRNGRASEALRGAETPRATSFGGLVAMMEQTLKEGGLEPEDAAEKKLLRKRG